MRTATALFAALALACGARGQSAITAGQTATFKVVANGTNPLSYQWVFNGATNLAKIGAAFAEQHYAETMVVTGRIAGFNMSINGNIVFLDLDKPFPQSPFIARVFSAATNQLGDLRRLKGKAVEIAGKIQERAGKPEIEVETTNQLVIVGNTADTGRAK
jgi:hypothetical protein